MKVEFWVTQSLQNLNNVEKTWIDGIENALAMYEEN